MKKEFFSVGGTEFKRSEVVDGDKCILDCPINQDVNDDVLQRIAIDVEGAMQKYYEYERMGVWDKERLEKKRLKLIEEIAHLHKALADEDYIKERAI
jgi:hypothetical protein